VKQKEIDRQLTIVEEAKHDFREAKNVLNEAESKLKGLRQLTMEDYIGLSPIVETKSSSSFNF